MATAKLNKSKSPPQAALKSKPAAKSVGKSKTSAKASKATPPKTKAATGKITAKTAAKSTAKSTARSGKDKSAQKAKLKTTPKTTAKTATKADPKSSAKKAVSAPKIAATKARKSPTKRSGKSKPVMLAHIDDRTLGKIVAKLEEMREESQTIVNAHMQSDLQPREESSDVGDDLDQASNERDREFSLIMHQRHLYRLQQIEEAFLRMDDGTYGLCEGTDESINPKRLLIMPLARYSLEYQEQQEKMLGRGMTGGEFAEVDESFSADE